MPPPGYTDINAHGSARVIYDHQLTDADLIDAGVVLVGENQTRRSFNRRLRRLRGFTGDVPNVGETLVCMRNRYYETEDHKPAEPVLDFQKLRRLKILGSKKMPPDLNGLVSAFRKAMLKTHPDTGGTNEQARAVIEAFEELKDQVGISDVREFESVIDNCSIWTVSKSSLIGKELKEVGKKGVIISHGVHPVVEMTLTNNDKDDPLQEIEVGVFQYWFQGRANDMSNKDSRRISAWCHIYKDLYQFDYGYAITVHKAQADEWDKVVVIDEPIGKRRDRRWRYTAITRPARKSSWLISRSVTARS